ncbi:unnamed protein product [Litomosoides sigmodontis]|uniref:Uncharacterized protein n=1 Tax=Litomosoides sigmodontis TaxID=42156 RepID=A0A3P6SMK3_LITSI|nr:unnamed protein product [Litomosoides sigmodontis]
MADYRSTGIGEESDSEDKQRKVVSSSERSADDSPHVSITHPDDIHLLIKGFNGNSSLRGNSTNRKTANSDDSSERLEVRRKMSDTYSLLERLAEISDGMEESSGRSNICQRHLIYSRPTAISSQNMFRLQALRNRLDAFKKLIKQRLPNVRLKRSSKFKNYKSVVDSEQLDNSKHSENAPNSENSTVSEQFASSVCSTDSEDTTGSDHSTTESKHPSNQDSSASEHSTTSENSTDSEHSSNQDSAISEHSTTSGHLMDPEHSSQEDLSASKHSASSKHSTDSERSSSQEDLSASKHSASSKHSTDSSNHGDSPHSKHSIRSGHSTHSEHSEIQEDPSNSQYSSSSEHSVGFGHSSSSEYLTSSEYLPSQKNPISSQHSINSTNHLGYLIHQQYLPRSKCLITFQHSISSQSFKTPEILQNSTNHHFRASAVVDEGLKNEGSKILTGSVDTMPTASESNSTEKDSVKTSSDSADKAETSSIYPLVPSSGANVNVAEEVYGNSRRLLNTTTYEGLSNSVSGKCRTVRTNSLITTDESYVEYFMCSYHSSNNERAINVRNSEHQRQPRNQLYLQDFISNELRNGNGRH